MIDSCDHALLQLLLEEMKINLDGLCHSPGHIIIIIIIYYHYY